MPQDLAHDSSRMRSCCSTTWSSMLLMTLYTKASSAKSLSEVPESTTDGMSFIYRRNNSGPNSARKTYSRGTIRGDVKHSQWHSHECSQWHWLQHSQEHSQRRRLGQSHECSQRCRLEYSHKCSQWYRQRHSQECSQWHRLRHILEAFSGTVWGTVSRVVQSVAQAEAQSGG